MNAMFRAATHLLLFCVYGFTWLVAILGWMVPRWRWQPTGRIMVTGTFHNPNWYLSHIVPLSRGGVKEVILVVDEPQLPLERVTFVCPPQWASRLLSRAGAKAIWMIVAGLRFRPDLYMGYHIIPGACSALVAGRLLGRPVCYQATAGPVEVIGGGFQADESIAKGLGGNSTLIESIALAVVRRFDCVVVRGRKARAYFQSQGVGTSIAIITGSVRSSRSHNSHDRVTDLVFVGRLAPIKQVDQFIEIVGAVSRVMPSIRAVIVGDGPLMADMEAYAGQLGVGDRIKFLGKRADVRDILASSKVFVLTSKFEGMSIALAEAMASGVVPVVADVGELADLVTDGVNGWLVCPDDIEQYTQRALSLLQDHALREELSGKATEAARRYCDIEVVSEKWRKCMSDTIARASRRRCQGGVK